MLLLVGETASWYLAPLIAWDAAALMYLLWMWDSLHDLDGDLTASHAVREDPSRSASDVAVVLASIASLGAVGAVLERASSAKGGTELLLITLGVLSVVLSWIVVHVIFMLRYAELYYTPPVGGINFNDERRPSYTDFAYLAFTLGMTFQVSDTELVTGKFRSTALKHALISYLFGTVIVATTINLIAGLTH